MRIKTLFSIPDGEKVTEKALRRVLISSICAILLCITCLASTTWAWFAVSIENRGNVIEIDEPKIELTVDGNSYFSELPLESGTHQVTIKRANGLDDLQKKSTLYVTLRLTLEKGNSTEIGYTTLKAPDYKKTITVNTESSVVLRWEVFWFAPDGVDKLTDSVLALADNDPTETTGSTETTGTTEETTSTAVESTEQDKMQE